MKSSTYARVTGVSAEDEALNEVIAASLEDPAAVAAVHGSVPIGGAGTSHGTSSGAGALPGGVGNEDADLEAAIAASLGMGTLQPATGQTDHPEPNGADAMMDDVAVVGTRLGGATDGDIAEPDAEAAEPKSVFLSEKVKFVKCVKSLPSHVVCCRLKICLCRQHGVGFYVYVFIRRDVVMCLCSVWG